MKRQFLFILLLAFAFNSNECVIGQKLYISSTGSDTNQGTREQPMASLSGAVERVREIRRISQQPGQVEIIALDGEYTMLRPLELTCEDNGMQGSSLRFIADEGAKPVFRGGIRIAGFEKLNEKLWRAFIPQVAFYDSYFEQLYVNGRRAVRARTPDNGFFFIRDVTETVIEKGNGRFPQFAVQKIILDSADASVFRSFSPQDFNDALITFYHKWDNTRKRIDFFNPGESALYTSGPGMKPWNSLDSQTRYFVDNYKAALDAPGEWYLERSGYLYYIPLEGESPENSEVYAPIISDFIKIRGESAARRVSNMSFENLSFQIAGYKTPGNGNEPAQAAAPVDAVISLDFAQNIRFVNCEIAHTGTYALWFRRGCTECSVNQCYMHDLGAGGVKIGETLIRPDSGELTKEIIVDNNIIRDGGHVFPCAVGIIIFHASDNKLTHNEISDLRYSGISAGWVWGYAFSPSKRNTIEYNHIHHLGWGELCDMGGVYTLGASEGTTVSNNVIHHVFSFDYGGWGLYTDEGSFGITEENNLVYACRNSGFHQHYGKENIIRNNIFALNIKAQLTATRIEEHRSITFTGNIVYFDQGTLLSSNWHKFNLLTDHNCYWDTRTTDIMFDDKSFSEWKASGRDVHSVIADPLFVNPKEYDFHFRRMTTARKIGFKPFDYSKAGVYGPEEWKKLSQFPRELEKKFNEIVLNHRESK